MPEEKLRPTYTFTEDRLAELRAVVPEAFEDGSINWDTLRDLLAPHLADESPDAENFGLSWPGKREARRLAAKPSGNTLRPAPGEGVNEDTTHNLYLEGDNLEVLKLLQKSYAGRVKMIYIDPPYNTGNDFVYKDNFTEPSEDYLRRTGQVGERGELLTTNSKADGRFHSNWLSMIYPRLRLARTLLCDDGMIFVSINDVEQSFLKSVMDEVFGQENWIATFIWNNEGNIDNQSAIKCNHEYVAAYAKAAASLSRPLVVDPNIDEASKIFRDEIQNTIVKNGPANPPSEILLPTGFPAAFETGVIRKRTSDYPTISEELQVEEFKTKASVVTKSGWSSKNLLQLFIRNGFQPILDNEGKETRFAITQTGAIYVYKARAEQSSHVLTVIRNVGTSKQNSQMLAAWGLHIDWPKPLLLISYLCQIANTTSDDIILDYFSGSATTAHAVLQLNREDGKNRRFIMVQIPERTPDGSVARQSGYTTITDIGTARIRQAITHIKEQSQLDMRETPEDLGFKVLTLGPSNFRAWRDYTGDSVDDLQQQFDLFEESPLADGWTPDSLLTEVLLLEGFPLDSTVTPQPQWTQNSVSCITSPACAHRLWTCFDEILHPDTVNGLALSDHDVFICRDSALDDNAKLRLWQTGTLKTI